ncbi:MAG: tetratricopeptide repeat protein [bacterium]
MLNKFLFLFYCASAVFAIPQQEISNMVVMGTHHIYREDFRQAQRNFDILIKKYPDHPAGYFYKAVLLDAEMNYYGSVNNEKEFYSLCDGAIERCKKLLKKEENDVWITFFLGGAMGFKGNYEARHLRYISAFRYGWSGFTYLEKAKVLSPNLNDADFGLGMYNYWKSRMMNKLKLWWLPGGDDKRAYGIKQLINGYESGLYTKYASAQALVWVYIEEGRYQEAADLARVVLKKYTHNRDFEWALGEALFKMGKMTESEKHFRYILDMCDADDYNTFVNSFRMRVRLARIYMKQKLYYKALAECRRAKYYRISSVLQADIKDEIDEAEQIIIKAKRLNAKNLPE